VKPQTIDAYLATVTPDRRVALPFSGTILATVADAVRSYGQTKSALLAEFG